MPAPERGGPAWRRIALLGGTHAVNDFYGSFLVSLLPFLIPALGLSLPMAGLLNAVHQMTSSVVQPVLGHLADRFGTRVFSVAGVAATGVGAASLGIAPSYLVLFGMVGVAGLGTAFFHPQSAAMVSSLSGRRRGTVMSAYITAGSAGFALGPMVVVGAATSWGLGATPVLAIPALLSALLLAVYAPRDWLGHPGDVLQPFWQIVRRHRSILVRLLGVAIFRSVTMFSWVAFVPLLFQGRGVPSSVWSGLLALFLFSGSAGGLVGGYLSDQVGSRKVIVSSLVITVPLLFWMIRAEGPGLWVVTGLAGATMAASFSTLTIKAQEMLPENVGMASGLVLGFAMGVGGLGTWPAGIMAESLGIFQTLSILAFLPLLAAPVAWMLPESSRGSHYIDKPGGTG